MNRHTFLLPLLIMLVVGIINSEPLRAQALNMDGQSGIFFQPNANVIPAEPGKFGAPTLSYHVVDAGPVAGSYLNVGLEEGFGNWIEFGFTRGNHTDGGNPILSPYFNYAGLNILNVKVKFVAENWRHHFWLPAIAAGAVIRTNDPFVSQSFVHKNGTNGDIYLVATKVVAINKVLPLLFNAGLRATDGEVYGYGGDSIAWKLRVFGAFGIPLPLGKAILVTPVVEIDTEPNRLRYLPTISIPTSLIYAVRVSRYPTMKWSVDIGTGHIGSHVAPGIDLKINNATAIAFDYRF